MTRVAVTGISGFTGSALVKQLLKEGYQVNALARRSIEIPVEKNLNIFEGDLGCSNTLFEMVNGADTVFHIAAMYRSEGSYDDFYKVNVEGTMALLHASQSAGVRRFVYCSTIGVHGNVAHTPADENTPFNPRDFYQETKLIAEKACKEESGKGIEIVIIRPCAIYGPGDTRMLKMFKMLNKGIFFFVGNGQPNFHPVYIDDLVKGFILAMTVKSAAGETFIIGGPRYMSLREYVAAAANAIQVPNPKLKIPYSLMSFAAWLCETICAPLGIQPPLHRRRLTFFKHNRAFDITKAKTLLGYKPRFELNDGFNETVAWYKQQGLL
ncbi:MAG TPA: NAD-dependent epimerase/dehydratase family protein [Methylophilaceae bacterium]|nr:NAD-dependent epimerase/dehydratase family protein [Methylophilaceae bacterium]